MLCNTPIIYILGIFCNLIILLFLSGLKFAPYKLTYDGISEHYQDSGLNKQINNWYDVDDFNWLVKDKQSPNWSIIPESDRVSHQC